LGIEQGNRLSDLILNLVMNQIILSLKEQGVPMLVYGDDVILVAPSREAAIEAFRAFQTKAEELGFTNILDWGSTSRKAPRIYEVDQQPVPLIKTYLVTNRWIGLVPEKLDALRSELPRRVNASLIRRKARCQSLTKAWIQEMDLLPPVSKVKNSKPLVPMNQRGETNLEDPVPPEDRVVPFDDPVVGDVVDDPVEGADGEQPEALCRVNPVDEDGIVYGDRHKAGGRSPTYTWESPEYYSDDDSCSKSTTPAALMGLPGHLSGKSGINNGRAETQTRTSVPARGQESEQQAILLPDSDPVLPILEDLVVVQRLRKRKRTRLGDRVKDKILDLRGLQDQLGNEPQVLIRSVRALLKAGRSRHVVRVLVHPGELWTMLPQVLGNREDDQYRVVSRTPHQLGTVLKLRQLVTRVPRSGRATVPPEHVAVLRCWASRPHRWSALLLLPERSRGKRIMVEVMSVSTTWARLETLVGALRGYESQRVALPVFAALNSIIKGKDKAKLVPRFRAKGGLAAWEWSLSSDRGWWLGSPR